MGEDESATSGHGVHAPTSATDGTGHPRSGHAFLLAEFEDVSELFRTLSSPVRIALVSLLTEGERCVHELVDELELPQPLVSQHLRILREADLVTRTRRGREVAYVLRDEHVAHIVADARSHSGEAARAGTADDDPVDAHADNDVHPAGRGEEHPEDHGPTGGQVARGRAGAGDGRLEP